MELLASLEEIEGDWESGRDLLERERCAAVTEKLDLEGSWKLSSKPEMSMAGREGREGMSFSSASPSSIRRHI